MDSILKWMSMFQLWSRGGFLHTRRRPKVFWMVIRSKNFMQTFGISAIPVSVLVVIGRLAWILCALKFLLWLKYWPVLQPLDQLLLGVNNNNKNNNNIQLSQSLLLLFGGSFTLAGLRRLTEVLAISHNSTEFELLTKHYVVSILSPRLAERTFPCHIKGIFCLPQIFFC